MMTREEKLQRLKEKRGSKDLIVITDSEKFIKSFSTQIDALRESLKEGVDVNDIDELLNKLSVVGELQPSLAKINETLEVISQKPDTPDVVTVKELDKVISAIKNQKLDDHKVQIEWINKKELNEITDALSNINKTIVEKAVNQSQNPQDFLPTRRVVRVGNKFFFDDNPTPTSGGGGSSIDISTLATAANQASQQTTLDAIEVAVEQPIVRTTDSISAADMTDAIMNGTSALTPKFGIISESSSGNNEVVAAVPTKKIRVLSYVLIANAAVNAKWRSADSADKSGLFYLAANTGASSGYSPVGHFETAAGEALNLNLSGAVAVGGHVTYIEV